MDPQDFDFQDPDPQKYADPRIRIQGVKYQPKAAKKKIFTPKIQSRPPPVLSAALVPLACPRHSARHKNCLNLIMNPKII